MTHLAILRALHLGQRRQRRHGWVAESELRNMLPPFSRIDGPLQLLCKGGNVEARGDNYRITIRGRQMVHEARG